MDEQSEPLTPVSNVIILDDKRDPMHAATPARTHQRRADFAHTCSARTLLIERLMMLKESAQ